MLKTQIVNKLIRSCAELSLLVDETTVAQSVIKGKFGDYSSNLPFELSKANSSNQPLEIAKKFKSKIDQDEAFEKVEAVSPGFLNFYFRDSILQAEVQKIIEKKDLYSCVESGKGKVARIEFVSANPTGPLHIGNARGGPLGDTIACILAKSGYRVIREYYNNDLGTQVEIFGNSLIALIKRKLGLETVKKEVEAYSGEYLQELADKLISELQVNRQNLPQLEEKLKEKALETLFAEIVSDCQEMGIGYDEFKSESSFQKEGATKRVIAFLTQKGLTKTKEGAVWFAPADEYLEDRESVLVRQDGRPTYFADDLAYHQYKFATKPDLVINVWGSNHHGHVPRMLAGIAALGEDVKKFRVILYQYVRVKRGNEVVKMSKRAGNFVTAAEVLEEVGKDALRFFLLQRAAATHLDFDLELAKKQSQVNPVYYVQYAHARMANILKQAKDFKEDQKVSTELLKEEVELELIRKLASLPELVEELSRSLQMHQLTTYSLELAETFHRFYESSRVLSEDQELTKARLSLVLASKIVLADCLKLLGISAPERM